MYGYFRSAEAATCSVQASEVSCQHEQETGAECAWNIGGSELIPILRETEAQCARRLVRAP